MTGGAGNDRFAISAGVADSRLTSATSNVGFDTITDFVANTGGTAATKNGDTINLGTAAGTFEGWVTGVGTVSTTTPTTVASGGLSLAQDLTTFITGALIQDDDDAVAITIGGAVAWAGSYLVIDDNDTDGFQIADTVIKLNTVATLNTNALVNTF